MLWRLESSTHFHPPELCHPSTQVQRRRCHRDSPRDSLTDIAHGISASCPNLILLHAVLVYEFRQDVTRLKMPHMVTLDKMLMPAKYSDPTQALL